MALVHTLYDALSNQHPHSSGLEGVFPIFWQEKRRTYGSAAAFDEANTKLKWFDLQVGAKVGSHAQGFTLTSAARATGKAYLKQTVGLQTTSETRFRIESMCTPALGLEDARQMPFRMRPSAIKSLTSTGGNTSYKNLKLSPAVVIDVRAVREFYKTARSYPHPEHNCVRPIEERAAYDRAQRGAIQALMLLDIAANFRASGDTLPCTYIESPTGRLYGQGSFTLQGCIRELRMAALKGHYDVDVNNCHWTLISQMATREAVETPYIQSYLEDKDATRERVAANLGISADQAKAVMVALLYGAGLANKSNYHVSAIRSLIGDRAFKRAGRDEILLNLNADLKVARRAVLASAKTASIKQGYIVNAAGRQMKLKGATVLQCLAHILQGAECEILKTCLSNVKGIVLPQHDGFTCKDKVDVGVLSAVVKEANGYDVTFSQTHL